MHIVKKTQLGDPVVKFGVWSCFNPGRTKKKKKVSNSSRSEWADDRAAPVGLLTAAGACPSPGGDQTPTSCYHSEILLEIQWKLFTLW